MDHDTDHDPIWDLLDRPRRIVEIHSTAELDRMLRALEQTQNQNQT